MQAELRIRSAHLAPFVVRRQAQVHVSVPLGNTERNAGVEFFFGRIFGRRVHDADELIAIALFFIKQGCRMIGIKVGAGFESVPVVCEVVRFRNPHPL